MGIAHRASRAVGEALRDIHAGADKLAARKVASGVLPTLVLKSPDFEANTRLPVSATADGTGKPPALAWDGIPRDAQSLVLVCEDPDAPFPEPYLHWLVYEIPTTARSIDATTADAWDVGRNSNMKTGFAGAAPPPGHGRHHYHFQLFALDTALDLEDGAGRGTVLDAMKGHVIGWGEIVGTYDRN